LSVSKHFSPTKDASLATLWCDNVVAQIGVGNVGDSVQHQTAVTEATLSRPHMVILSTRPWPGGSTLRDTWQSLPHHMGWLRRRPIRLNKIQMRAVGCFFPPAAKEEQTCHSRGAAEKTRKGRLDAGTQLWCSVMLPGDPDLPGQLEDFAMGTS
jgi:hypothetical protein